MIVSAPIFLILVVPLLVHGAPTPPPPETKYGELPPGFAGGLLPPPTSRPGNQITLPSISEVVSSPGPHAIAAKPRHPKPQNPDRFVNPDFHNTIKAPKGTTYHVSTRPDRSLPLESTGYSTRTKRVATTHGPLKKTILIPPRIEIIMSDKDDELLVPPEPTEIRIIDDKDKDDIVVAFCKKVHEETKPKPGHEKQQWEPYKRCCVEENLWNYGSGLELVKVPVSTYYVKTH